MGVMPWMIKQIVTVRSTLKCGNVEIVSQCRENWEVDLGCEGQRNCRDSTHAEQISMTINPQQSDPQSDLFTSQSTSLLPN